MLALVLFILLPYYLAQGCQRSLPARHPCANWVEDYYLYLHGQHFDILITAFIFLHLPFKPENRFINTFKGAFRDTFGKRLTECRKAKNLSQKELAEAFITSHTTIGKYERDEMAPSIDAAK